jgi:hypothetical protein
VVLGVPVKKQAGGALNFAVAILENKTRNRLLYLYHADLTQKMYF